MTRGYPPQRQSLFHNFVAIDDPALDGQISSFLGAVVDGETKVFGLQTDNRIKISPQGDVAPFNSLLSHKPLYQ